MFEYNSWVSFSVVQALEGHTKTFIAARQNRALISINQLFFYDAIYPSSKMDC